MGKKKLNGLIIGHPGTGEPIKCESFEEAMYKYFEGFNIPFYYKKGKREDFETANNRVKEYFKKRK